jgi:tetratricopeptide (TPR) repeat protein
MRAERRPTLSLIALLCGVLAIGGGCRLVRGRGPAPDDVVAARRLSNEALAAADRDDLPQARGLLERAVRQCPSDVDARRHYAELLWREGDRVAAVVQMREALRLSPGDVPLSIAAGQMVLEMGLLDDADTLAASAVQLAPRSHAAWRLHGQVARARGRPEEALADYQRALALAPNDRDLLLETAEVYRQLGRPRRALSTLAMLEELYGPGGPPGTVLALEGHALEALERPAEAAEAYRRAVARGDAPATAAERLAAIEAAGVRRR